VRKPLLIPAIILSACTLPTTNWPEVHQQAHAVLDQWEQQRVTGLLVNYADVERCASPKIRALYVANHFQYIDLIDLYQAKRLVIAEKRDRQELSDSDAAVQIAEIRVQVISEMEQRSTAAAARAAAISSMMPVSCTTVGNSTVCY
jgi:hypothetical protein